MEDRTLLHNYFNVCKFMSYCTYDLVAFYRYDLVALMQQYNNLLQTLKMITHCIFAILMAISGNYIDKMGTPST